VFCSFNNNYKYTPEVFAAWMSILRRVPGSALWLLSDNPWAQANLQREAEVHGVDPQRLVFAERAWPEQYLARYALPDLFLDTFPFNAGTTANDALWMGLPVLTLTGRSFAARMAGALLTAANLPELITYDLQAYEDKAVELATTPGACLRLREHLEGVRASGVLFDTPRFVRNLEQELVSILQPVSGAAFRPGAA
jgi:predicted O-linked N-acetylglucosamine transferase (SPINDLY family)